MPRPAIRFHPPPVEITPDLRWMLARAFGPRGGDAAPPGEPARALELARRFDLATRIAARTDRERLTAEAGEEVAGQLARDRAVAAAMDLQLLHTAQRVAELAAEISLPLCGLKFLALEASGHLLPGSRSACDVDLLVPAASAPSFWLRLQAAGFVASGLPPYEHQLPTLVAPEGGAVEIHRVVPGLRLDGSRSATYEDLAQRGLLQPVDGYGGALSVPERAVQAAHAVVHGLGQHGFWPDSYPLFKMVADLADLGLAAGEGWMEGAWRWIGADVPPAELEAVRALCRHLTEGDERAAERGGPERRLLEHILAGRLDDDYAKALRLGLFRHQPSDRSAPVRVLRSMIGAVVLSDAQIDAIYGPPQGRLGYLGRRLARPFDLALRLGTYGWRALRFRR